MQDALQNEPSQAGCVVTIYIHLVTGSPKRFCKKWQHNRVLNSS